MGRLLRAVAICVPLVITGGCAFPLFNMESREPRSSYAYADRHGRDEPRSRGDRERPRGTASRSSRTRTQQGVRSASVLSSPTSVLQEAPPAPSGTPEECFESLRAARVQFEQVDDDDANGVQMPLRLLGPINGVTFAPSDKSETHAILDCRLALALVEWSRDLRARGVIRVEHYSMYRPGAHVAGDGRVSGHAHGLAIDAARFTLEDGTLLDVLNDWEGREHGASPCPMRPDEGFGSRVLRSVTCDAVDQKLFQIVITPHHDRAHKNHVHLERKPEVDWTYVR